MRIVAAGGADITITSPLQAAGADGQTNSTSGIPTYDLLSGFNGTTWDRLRALGDNADGVASASLGRLLALARLSGYNGASWDRLLSEGNDRDAIANTTLGNLQTLGFPHGYNGASWDRIRTLGDTSGQGLGQLSVSPAVPGASVVKAYSAEPSASTSRVTLVTPASGKKIRVIGIGGGWLNSAVCLVNFYFGTGANAQTNPGSMVGSLQIEEDATGGSPVMFPDGGGPLGAADEVLSLIRSSSSTTGQFWAVYREE